MPAKKSIAKILGGRRFSRSRTAILKTLQKKHCCTVEELLRAFPDSKAPHKTTMYRELENLVSHDFVRELDFGDGSKRYEIKTDEHHHHLICTECGALEPIRLDDDLNQKVGPLAARLGFVLTHHTLEFFGLCETCKA